MESGQVPQIAKMVLVLLALGVAGGCSKPATQAPGGIEGTNVAAKQGWEKRRSAEDAARLRDRLLEVQTDS